MTVQLISDDKQEGKTLRRVRFKVDTTRMAAGVADLSTRQTIANSNSINVDIWVNDDNLVERMALSVEMQNGTGAIIRTAFSNLNGPVNIQPPR